MANEARTDDGAKATFEAGSRARGDRIGVEGTGWTLTLTHVEDRQEEEEDAPLARGVLACARLLLTEEYERRRKSPSGWTRPILQTLSVLLSHTYRCRYIWQTLNELDGELWDDDTVAIRCHLFGRTREVGGDPADALVEAVDRVLAHDQDLGGRAAIQVNRRCAETSWSARGRQRLIRDEQDTVPCDVLASTAVRAERDCERVCDHAPTADARQRRRALSASSQVISGRTSQSNRPARAEEVVQHNSRDKREKKNDAVHGQVAGLRALSLCASKSSSFSFATGACSSGTLFSSPCPSSCCTSSPASSATCCMSRST